jgi:hypothetical protein
MSLAKLIGDFWQRCLNLVPSIDETLRTPIRRRDFVAMTKSRGAFWNNALGAFLQQALDECDQIPWAPGFVLQGSIYSISGKYDKSEHSFLEATLFNVQKKSTRRVYLDITAMQFGMMDEISGGFPVHVCIAKNETMYAYDVPSERVLMIRRAAMLEMLYDKRLESRMSACDPLMWFQKNSLDQTMISSDRPALELIKQLCQDWLDDYPERFKGLLLM